LEIAGFHDTKGGQHERDFSRDRAGGGTKAELFMNAF